MEKEKAVELASSLKTVMEESGGVFQDFNAAMALAGKTKAGISELSKALGRGNADSAASTLEQCLLEIERLNGQPRPRADETAQALAHFKAAYAAMTNARASQDKWLPDVESAISTARDAVQRATNAVQRMKTAKERLAVLEDEFRKLHIDESRARKRSLEFAAKLEDDARKMRKDVDSTWGSATGAGSRADVVLGKAEKQLKEAGDKMDALVKLHGNYIAEAPRRAFEKALDDFHTYVTNVRSKITSWTEAGEYGVARAGHHASAKRMEVLAKSLREGSADWDSATSEVATFKSVGDFTAKANYFISDMGNVDEYLGRIVQTANESVVAAENSLPDWGGKTTELNQRRQTLCADIASEEGVLTSAKGQLETCHADGNVRNEILQGFASALKGLEVAKQNCAPFKLAANGLEYEKQRQNWEALEKAGRKAIEQARSVNKNFENAIAEGKFYRVSYKPCAEVWAMHFDGKSYGSKGLMPENSGLNLGKAVEIADYRPNAELGKIGWKFAVKIPKPGKHVLQVKLSTVSGKPINTSAKGKRSSRRIKDGEITVLYDFSSSSGMFKVEDGYTGKRLSFENGQGRKSCVVSSISTNSGRWEEFEFTIDSILLDVKEHSVDENTRWDYTPITFSVTLDGTEVELYHAERVRLR